MDDKTLRLASRIRATSDGMDFIDFLKQESKSVYDEFKKSSSELNDVYKGKLIALDGIIRLLEECDYKLKSGVVKDIHWA